METNKTYSVYKHTFPNGKVYIGITCMDPQKRWNGGSGYRKQPKIYNAIQYYGWRNVKHEILYTGLSKAEAEAEEIRLIAHYDSTRKGYNVEHGGNTVGTHSEETKWKIGKGNRGKKKPCSEERKQHLRDLYASGKMKNNLPILTDEQRAEHAAFMVGNQYAKGLKHTDEFKAWKSKQMHEKYKDGNHPRSKRVIGIDENGETVEYASLRIAAKEVGACPATMHKHVHEGTPFGGHIWKYSE